MASKLKNTGAGNLFVVFGEPNIVIEPAGADQVQVSIKGVDVFHLQTGEAFWDPSHWASSRPPQSSAK